MPILQEEREITDKPDAKDLVITDGVIEFRDVHFGYSKEVEAISGINFKVEKGESVALVRFIGILIAAYLSLTSLRYLGR